MMNIANPATARHLRRRILALAAVVLMTVRPAAAIGDLVVHDAFSGVAIGGYDPVSYFLYGEPRPGDPEIEVEWSGAYFVFENRGNAAAFADAPAVFAPAYGGHGVAGVARGQPQEGDPKIFAIHGNRLFLFHSADDRALFLSDPEGMTARADQRWPAVRAMLAP